MKKQIVSLAVLFVLLFAAGQVFAQDTWTASSTSDSPLSVNLTEKGVSVRIGRWVTVDVEHSCDEETGEQSLDIFVNEDPHFWGEQDGVEILNETHPERKVHVHVGLNPAKESKVTLKIDFLKGPETGETLTLEGTLFCTGPECEATTPVQQQVYKHHAVAADQDRYAVCILPAEWFGMPVKLNEIENYAFVKMNGEVNIDFYDELKGKGNDLFTAEILTGAPALDENLIPILSQSPTPYTLFVNNTNILLWTWVDEDSFYSGISRQMRVLCIEESKVEQQTQSSVETNCPTCEGYVCENRGTTWSYFDPYEGENRWAAISEDGSFVNDLEEPADGLTKLGFQCSECQENTDLEPYEVRFTVTTYPANLWERIAEFRGHESVKPSDQKIAQAIAIQWEKDVEKDSELKQQKYDIRDFVVAE